MYQRLTARLRRLVPHKTVAIPLFLFGVIALMAAMTRVEATSIEELSAKEEWKKDSVESVKAFMQVYPVLMSPRCMNCHPSGEVPLQGEDSHVHAMQPQRGPDGKGVSAMKCANCHQASNVPGLHTPPGNPNWHMPSADMKMVFQGKTPRELAKQLMDPAQNGHKSKEQLIAHATDGLVLAGWNPGEGRKLPPISHEEFAKAWVKWIKKGAFAPGNK